MKNSPPNWSLGKVIKKRKTQTTLRAIGSKTVQSPELTSRPEPVLSDAVPPPTSLPASRMIDSKSAYKRTTQVSAVVTGASRWTQPQKRIAVAAACVIVVLCTLVVLLVSSQLPGQQALTPLPVADTVNVIRYLKEAGVPIADVKTFAVPNAMWNAREEIQFVISRRNEKGTFVMLTYVSSAEAGIDAFKATYHPKFARWKLIQISNLLVLSSPETNSLLSSELANHLNRYLVAPYRSFVPTAIPGTW
jgi:hypothetical protein